MNCLTQLWLPEPLTHSMQGCATSLERYLDWLENYLCIYFQLIYCMFYILLIFLFGIQSLVL